MTAATAERMGVGFEDFKTAAASQIPVNRVGQPEDIAHTASFFVSEGAGFVSGQVVYVAGGPKDWTVRSPLEPKEWAWLSTKRQYRVISPRR